MYYQGLKDIVNEELRNKNKTINEHIVEEQELLVEKQIIINDGKQYGQIVFLAGGAGCFTGDTIVKTENGYEEIKNIKEGTKVWTINEETKEEELKPVEKNNMFESHEEELLELTFENGERVVCTESHEFYVDGKWIKAKDL